MEYETHFPPGSEGAQAAEEVAKAAADAEAKAAQDATAAETATADEAKAKEAEVAAAAEAEAKAKADEEAEKLTKKPRSIYDDLKDENGTRRCSRGGTCQSSRRQEAR
jgi:membrane protein involved in colicin uptake